MTEDYRVFYLEEARECLRASNKILKKYPNDWDRLSVYWANLLGAIANATLSSVPEEVAMGLLAKDEKRRKDNERIRRLLDEELGKRK